MSPADEFVRGLPVGGVRKAVARAQRSVKAERKRGEASTWKIFFSPIPRGEREPLVAEPVRRRLVPPEHLDQSRDLGALHPRAIRGPFTSGAGP